MIKGIEQNTKKTGRFEIVLLLPPPLPLPPPLVAFRFWCQTSWNTFVVTAKLMPKLIECAICFDACVATVPTIPATSKGQHHDPIIAGKEKRIVKTTVARFPFPPEEEEEEGEDEEELKGGCSFETKKDEFRIFVVVCAGGGHASQSSISPFSSLSSSSESTSSERRRGSKAPPKLSSSSSLIIILFSVSLFLSSFSRKNNLYRFHKLDDKGGDQTNTQRRKRIERKKFKMKKK